MSATTSTHEPRRLSDEEWVALGEEVLGELVDGELVEEEVPDPAHEAVLFWLTVVVGAWLKQQRGGHGFGSGLKYLLRKGRGRKPDLSFFLPGGVTPPRHGALTSPPDIAVEVISRGPKDMRRDRIAKMNEYAAFGIRWYWLIDPEGRTFEIYERTAAGVYARVVGAGGGAVATVPGVAGLSLDLDELWSRIDELDEGGDFDDGDDEPDHE